MAAKRAFISFDFDHDEDIRNLLVGQSRHPNSPFTIQDWSVKEPMVGDWKEKVRKRIRQTDLTIVLCGVHTNTARGVSAELKITREEENPYFLLAGRKSRSSKPIGAEKDKMYEWTWENLKKLIGGAR